MRSVLLVTLTLVPFTGVAAQPPALAPLHRFYNTSSDQHSYSMDPGEISRWRSNPAVREDLVVGRVATQPLPGTVRLYRAIRGTNQRHFYYTTAGDLHRGVTMELKHFDAYVWTEPGDGRVAIYSSTGPDGTDVLYDTSLEKVRRFGNAAATGAARVFSGPEPVFYVYPLEGDRQGTASVAAQPAVDSNALSLSGAAPMQSETRQLSADLNGNQIATAPAEDLADVIERCEKSVVRIEVHTDRGEGLGSGFVIAEKTIATNVHVLAGARRAKVIFADQREFWIDGILAMDEQRDIAIATLSGSRAAQLPVLHFANDTPRKGESVFTLGSPLGLSFTATAGVVSAIRSANDMQRELGEGDYEGTWIQVDAALSPGNSGGPIIDKRGLVVAMSTLASQGAQNLNFGISGMDVKRLLELSRTSSVSSLADSVGRLERRSGSDGRGGGQEVVPSEAVQAYVQKGREDYAGLNASLVREIGRLRSNLREMRAGETSIPLSIRRQSPGAAVIRVTDTSKRNLRTWYFASQKVKDEEIDALSERAKELAEIRLNTVDRDSPTALFTLLWRYGPKVDTRKKASVGFMSDCTVINPLNEHEVLVLFDDAPYVLYLDSTAGLSIGREVTPCPVLVTGTMTVKLPGGSTTAVTRLQAIRESDLKTAVDALLAGADSSASLPSELRTWTDQTGKFSVEATLIGVVGEDVELKRPDGKTFRVPINKLSIADQRLLGK